MEQVVHFFPELSNNQYQQFAALDDLYRDWNAKINVISRKDIESLYVKHVLHSLGIAKIQTFLPGSAVLDVGTGGGFPGIPLAILFPEVNFHLIDVIGKKITVVQAVADQLGLNNVLAEQIRVQQVTSQYDFIVSRAVTNMSDFVAMVRGKVRKESVHERRNGILYLKGGDLDQELAIFSNTEIYSLADFFDDPFFETKKVVYLPMKYKPGWA